MKTSIKTILAGTLVFAAFFGATTFAYANHNGSPDIWDIIDHVTCGTDGCESVDDIEDNGIYWRGGDPVVHTLGATSISRSSVTIQAHYDSAGADYNMSDLPKLFIRYGEDRDMERITSTVSQGQGSRVVSFHLANLDSDTDYYYQAVLIYRGGQVAYGDRLMFTTLRSGQSPIVDCTFDDNRNVVEGVEYFFTADDQGSCVPHGVTATSNSGSSNTSSTPPPVVSHTPSTNTSSQSSSGNQVAGISKTSNEGVVIGSSGNVSLRITNSESSFKEGEKVRFNITISNTGTTSARSGRVTVTLPSEYEFSKSTDGSFDKQDNELTIRLSTLAGGSSKTISVDARVSGVRKDDSVTTRAVLTFSKAGVSHTVRASDTDDVETASGNILGASVFGAGFFPQTLTGWVMLIIIITALIFVIRRYSKGDIK